MGGTVGGDDEPLTAGGLTVGLPGRLIGGEVVQGPLADLELRPTVGVRDGRQERRVDPGVGEQLDTALDQEWRPDPGATACTGRFPGLVGQEQVQHEPVGVAHHLAEVGVGEADHRADVDRLGRFGAAFGLFAAHLRQRRLDDAALEIDREPHVTRCLTGHVARLRVGGEPVQRELAGDELGRTVVPHRRREDAAVETGAHDEVGGDEHRRPRLGARAVAGALRLDVVGERIEGHAVGVGEHVAEQRLADLDRRVG